MSIGLNLNIHEQLDLICELTIDIQPGAVAGSTCPVGGSAGVQPPVLPHSPADVDVADHLPMHRHVLPHHVPGSRIQLYQTLVLLDL